MKMKSLAENGNGNSSHRAWLARVRLLMTAGMERATSKKQSPIRFTFTTKMKTGGQAWHDLRTKLCLLLGIALTPLVLAGCFIGPSSGPEHVFVVEPPPPFLTEELAVAKARETLAKEGYKLNDWQITRTNAPHGHAPDGTPDKYLRRFGTNYGRLHFKSGKGSREYDVRLESNRVVCSSFQGL